MGSARRKEKQQKENIKTKKKRKEIASIEKGGRGGGRGRE